MGKMKVYNKIVTKTRKRKNMEIEEIYKKILKWNLQLAYTS